MKGLGRPVKESRLIAKGGSFKFEPLAFPSLKILSIASDAAELSLGADNSLSLLLPVSGFGRRTTTHGTSKWSSDTNFFVYRFDEPEIFNFDSSFSAFIFAPKVDQLLRAADAIYGRTHTLGKLPQTTAQCEFREQDAPIRSLMSSTISLLATCGDDPAHLARIGFDEVLLRLLAEIVFGQKDIEEISSPRRSARAVNLICELISSNGGKPLTLTDMEQATGLTKRALTYAFQDRFGVSPQQWQRNYRLDLARREILRLDQTQSLKSISRKLGFSSEYSFAKFYRQRFGELPSQMKRP